MHAIKAGLIRTITNGDIKDGVIIVDKGKILEIGQNVSIPENANIIDASDKEAMPGMIDAHTHIGLIADGAGEEARDHNEMTEPFTPHLRVIDAIDPFDRTFSEVMQAGITTVLILPGSANPIGGRCSVFKTYGRTADEMMVIDDAGMKFAFGENPKRIYGSQKKMPCSRMGIAGVIREQLWKAMEYSIRDKDRQPARPDFKLDALQSVIKGKTKARIHAHKAYDIMTAIRICDEFGLSATLEHCTEGSKIINEIASRKIPVVLSPLMNARGKYETRERNFETAAEMSEKGILVAISTDGISQSARWLPLNAGLCIRWGMKEEDAFKAITINPAKILGIEDRIGSLEAGKEADIIITDGHPLETRTKVTTAMINGKIRYQRTHKNKISEE